MADEPVEGRPELVEEEDGGGPVKTFLEHLEDLRWTLLKSAVAIVVSMLVCMVAGNKLVAILTWPLDHSLFLRSTTNQIVTLHFGTNVLATARAGDLGAAFGITNKVVALRLTPVDLGTNRVFGFLAEPGPVEEAKPSRLVTLKNYSPLGSIVVTLKLALYGGLVLASPFVMYFIGQFVLPALRVKEKKLLFKSVSFGAGLFFLGVAFCYFVIANVALNSSVMLSQWLGFGADEWRAEDYISFVCKFMLGMGLSFQLPVVILVLVKIGLLDYQKLAKFRSYAIIANLVVAAFATPSGDPFTMFLMALPLQILYEVSVIVAWFWARQDRKKAEAEAKG